MTFVLQMWPRFSSLCHCSLNVCPLIGPSSWGCGGGGMVEGWSGGWSSRGGMQTETAWRCSLPEDPLLPAQCLRSTVSQPASRALTSSLHLSLSLSLSLAPPLCQRRSPSPCLFPSPTACPATNGACLSGNLYARLFLRACLSVYFSSGPPVCLLPACPSACLPACLSICLSACLPVHLPVCLPATLPGQYLSAGKRPGCQPCCQSARLSARRFVICVCVFACLPARLSECLPVCLSICLSSVYLSVCVCAEVRCETVNMNPEPGSIEGSAAFLLRERRRCRGASSSPSRHDESLHINKEIVGW